jgi:hypothetical protein
VSERVHVAPADRLAHDVNQLLVTHLLCLIDEKPE